MHFALFLTCVNDTLFPSTGQATVELLERLGHRVSFPEGQTCCGQIHANAGYEEQALPLLRRFVDVFADPAFDAIVAPSASCAAMVIHQYPRLAAASGDEELRQRVALLAERTFELSQLLVGRLGVVDVGAYFPHRVTYQPTCHGLRLLRLGDAPLRLLRAVRGLELVGLGDAETCCGFGGTFAVKNADVSTAMLSDKLGHLHSSGAEVCAAVDNSCLLHISGGLSRTRAPTRTLHLAEILAATDGGAAA